MTKKRAFQSKAHKHFMKLQEAEKENQKLRDEIKKLKAASEAWKEAWYHLRELVGKNFWKQPYKG